jgi:hypothetical protein
MGGDLDIARALAVIAATLNDQKLEHFDTRRVQVIVTESLGGGQKLILDDAGGLHDESGTRVGAIRRTPSGEWITERQNGAAERSHAAIPPEPDRTGIRGLVRKIRDRV